MKATRGDYLEILEEYNDYILGGDINEEIVDRLLSLEKPPKRIRTKSSKIKICAGCGSFAHGNPGHDIT